MTVENQLMKRRINKSLINQWVCEFIVMAFRTILDHIHILSSFWSLSMCNRLIIDVERWLSNLRRSLQCKIIDLRPLHAHRSVKCWRVSSPRDEAECVKMVKNTVNSDMNKVNTNYLTPIDWFCEVTEIWTNMNWLLIETRKKWCSYMSSKSRFDSGWMITCHWLIMR